jgi:hypothetical protein
MYVVITDQAGEVLVARNMKTNAEEWLKLIEPYRSDLVVAVNASNLLGPRAQLPGT